MSGLRKRDADVTSLHKALGTTTPVGDSSSTSSPPAPHTRDLLTRPENTVASIAKVLASRNTINKYVPELKGGRLALAEAASTPELPRPAKTSE